MDLHRAKISHVRVYDAKDYVYVVGTCLLSSAGRGFAASLEGRDEVFTRSSATGESAERYRLLRFEKARTMMSESRKFRDCVYEDPSLYTAKELESALRRLAEGNRRTGGLNRIMDAVAIAGVIKFVKGYYLVLIANRAEEGQLDEHVIYAAKGSQLVPLFDEAAIDASVGAPARRSAWSLFSGAQDPITAMEEEFKSLFKLVDLSRAFYWSYTYNLSVSAQRNVASQISSRARERDPSVVPPGAANAIGEDNLFVWNEYLARPLLDALKTSPRSVFLSPWTVALVHGSFKQQRCSILSRSLTLTLVARRSRYYAGTRYLKRGVNDDGYVANDVEIEQIVQDHMLLPTDPGGVSAYVQMRGSIPTFWSQETSVAMPKPPIKRQRFDPWYNATRKHFMDLINRYGDSIIILNLVKQTEKRKRETIVGSDFKHAIEVLNSTLPTSKAIEYCAVDFTRLSKVDPSSLLRALDTVAKQAIRETSFFMAPTKALRFTEVHNSAPAWLAKSHRELRADMRNPESYPFGGQRRKAISQDIESQRLPLRWSSRLAKFVPMRLNTALKLHSGQPTQLTRELSRDNIQQFSRESSFARSINLAVLADTSSINATRDDEDDDFARNSSATENENADDVESTTGTDAGGKARSMIGADDETGGDLGSDHEANFLHANEGPSSDAGGSAGHGLDTDQIDPEDKSPGIGIDDDEEDEDEDEEELGFTDLVEAQPPVTPAYPSSPARTPRTPTGADSRDTNAKTGRIQHGVLRTNCIDCLDRTNLAQFLIGLHVINEQLIALGILSIGERVTTDTPIAAVLMEMYEELGDRIAMQYGGSDAHRKSGKLVSSGSTSTRQQAFYTSLKRYYSNAFTDHAKQDAINVFLGLYRPEHHKRQRENADGTGDFYLHNRGVTYRPNFSLRPRVLELGQWWSKPLSSFAERVMTPLRALGAHPYELLSPNTPDQDLSDRGRDGGLASFDALFAKPYFKPRDLVSPNDLIPLSFTPGLSSAQLITPPSGGVLSKFDKDGQKDISRRHARLRRAPFSSETVVSSSSSGTRNTVSPEMRARLFPTRSANNVLRSGDDVLLEDESEDAEDNDSHDSSISLEPSMSAAEALLDPSLGVFVGDLDVVSQAYVRQAEDPFSLYEHPSSACMWRSELGRASALDPQPWISMTTESYGDAWNRRSHEREYRDALSEQQIHENDGWGMRRLQAYSGSTSVIMSGMYKGYPRSVTAAVLELK